MGAYCDHRESMDTPFCASPAIYECGCTVCRTVPPADRYHACANHLADVARRHEFLYRRSVVWRKLPNA